MSTSFIRWGGLTAMVSGLLWIATITITASKPEHPLRGPEGFIALLLVGLLLIAVGVLGIHVKQRRRSGRLATAAVLTAGSGIAPTVLGRVAVDIGMAPAFVFQADLLTSLIGLVLFVISIFVAHVTPRGAWLLVTGTLSLALFNFGDERI